MAGEVVQTRLDRNILSVVLKRHYTLVQQKKWNLKQLDGVVAPAEPDEVGEFAASGCIVFDFADVLSIFTKVVYALREVNHQHIIDPLFLILSYANAPKFQIQEQKSKLMESFEAGVNLHHYVNDIRILNHSLVQAFE